MEYVSIPNGVIRFTHPPSKCKDECRGSLSDIGKKSYYVSDNQLLMKLCRLCEIHHVEVLVVRWETSSGHHRKKVTSVTYCATA